MSLDPQNNSSHAADESFECPPVHVPVIKIRQPDGSLMVKAGRPEIVESEVGVTIFHQETGISKRHIATLCEQGAIQHRRLTPKKDSKILIPRTEIDRFRGLGYVAATAPKSPCKKPPLPSPSKKPQTQPTPSRGSARRGLSISRTRKKPD
jgi:hypothetical protein